MRPSFKCLRRLFQNWRSRGSSTHLVFLATGSSVKTSLDKFEYFSGDYKSYPTIEFWCKDLLILASCIMPKISCLKYLNTRDKTLRHARGYNFCLMALKMLLDFYSGVRILRSSKNSLKSSRRLLLVHSNRTIWSLWSEISKISFGFQQAQCW